MIEKVKVFFQPFELGTDNKTLVGLLKRKIEDKIKRKEFRIISAVKFVGDSNQEITYYTVVEYENDTL